MLLCVDNGTRLIRLYNVNVTDIGEDEEVFGRLRDAYGKRSRNLLHRFFKPTKMEYVKVRNAYSVFFFASNVI